MPGIPERTYGPISEFGRVKRIQNRFAHRFTPFIEVINVLISCRQ
ncbi:hypothetical protein C7S14_7163 [Burkholderia cepacia]|nr:hypothetical protein C7S14_7163 [Burkholderia cepacia]